MSSEPLLDALIASVKSYNPDADEKLIAKAVAFAKKHHGDQKRASGEPYYTHPVEVAEILATLHLDTDSIITAILHDTIEDTDVTFEDIEKEFSRDVATLVNGVSKLTKIESQTVEGKQAENFRKLLLAMSEDIRVLLVKLADRLHNVRTLHHIEKPEKRRRIARETMDIYAPLAERIGIHKIKEEIEDLAFAQLNPEARESIANRLDYLRTEENNLVKDIITELGQNMKAADIDCQVTGREKTRYSIWKKMQRKNVSFEQLSDIMAFRVIVPDVGACYNALGVIHSKYPTIPGRFKDYISTPKPNGYRSIHTTIMGPQGKRIEVQIRTKSMHEEAELGVAAHWEYKQGKPSENAQRDSRQYRWLRELLEILDQEQRPEDFLEHTKLELFQENVFAFTPRGDLLELPNGATLIDFAYAIHSDVGSRCVGCKVNGRIAPLNTKVQNGDQIEIITSKTQHPSPTWERFAVTGKARSHIRRYVRQQQEGEYVQLGKAILQKIFRQESYEFSDKAFINVLKYFKADDADSLYAKVGSGLVTGRDVFKEAFPDHKTQHPVQKAETIEDELNQTTSKTAKQHRSSGAGKNAPMPIKGLIPGMAVHYARCCHPLPGDRIVGIVSTGKGVTIHTIDCDTLETFADTPERWLDVSWGDGPDAPETHIGRLRITLGHNSGALSTLSTVIAKNEGNITNLKITNRTSDFWDMIVDVHVQDIKHLNNVIAALRAEPVINSVERAKGR